MKDDLPMMDYAALGVKVHSLETGLSEVKDTIAGLDTKIDRAISGLSNEVRAAISTLASQFAERNKPQWLVMLSAAGFLVTVLGGIGWQALNPVREAEIEQKQELNALKEEVVPRKEVEFRYSVNDKRLSQLEADAREWERRRYDETQKKLDLLQRQLDAHRP